MTTPLAPVSTVGNPGSFTQAVAGGALGKDEFIKLLVAQMTHQDPLAPMDGQQMASQLAQFSSVEQLMQLGNKLDAQAAASNALLGVVNNASALDLIGKTVTVVDDQVYAGPGGTTSCEIAVPADGGAGTLQVLDATGTVLRTVDLGRLAGGERTLDLGAALDGLPRGTYRIAVDVQHPDGGTATVATRMAVRVDGVRMSPDGAHITAGPLSFPIGLIDSVRASLPTS